MLLLVIQNASSGSDSLSEKELRRVLEDAGHEIRYRSFHQDSWKRELHEPADAIVAVGGDGTVRRVAIALSALDAINTPLAIIPAGTANNLARNIGFEGPAARIAIGLATARTGRVAIGLVQRPGEHDARFVESAGLGVFARMLREAPTKGTQTMEDGLRLLRRIVEKTEPQMVRIEADGADLSGEYVMVEAMNVGSIGPRLMFAPRADHTDDRLDLVLIGPPDRVAMLEYLDALERGAPADFPGQPRQVRRIRLDWERGHVDDATWPSHDGANDRSGTMVIQVERHLSLLIP